MDKHVEQLNILLQAIKDIVKTRACPDWVSKRLADAVKRAKELQPNDIESVPGNKYIADPILKPFTVGEKVISNIQNDICLYEIIDILLPVGGINLYNVKILEGNKDNPPGMIVHNVPETILQHIKEQNG